MVKTPQTTHWYSRGPKSHISTRILHTMVSGIPPVLGLRARVQDHCVCVVFRPPMCLKEGSREDPDREIQKRLLCAAQPTSQDNFKKALAPTSASWRFVGRCWILPSTTHHIWNLVQGGVALYHNYTSISSYVCRQACSSRVLVPFWSPQILGAVLHSGPKGGHNFDKHPYTLQNPQYI